MAISQLARLQHRFQDAVLQEQPVEDVAWVSASGRATPQTQLAIYGYAYRARLREVLENDFPAIHMAIGDEQFSVLAENYIQEYPSRYFSLRDFGSHVPKFVARLVLQDERYHEMGWLYELAIFEWMLGKAFDAKDTAIFTEQEMTTIPADRWGDIRFVLHPSVQCLDLEWNIPIVWQALTSDKPYQVTATRTNPSPWLIWRQQLVTRFRSIQKDEQLALDTILADGDFTAVCEVLATYMDEEQVPMHAAGLLKGWIAQGLINRVLLEQ